MFRKRLLLLFGAIALASGLAFTPSQAAEFCSRPNFCHDKEVSCRWNCAGGPGGEYVQCVEACQRVYKRCCSA